jgi:hypothetical protein
VTAPERGPRADETAEETFFRGFAEGWHDRAVIADAEEKDRVLVWLNGFERGARAATTDPPRVAKSMAVRHG